MVVFCQVPRDLPSAPEYILDELEENKELLKKANGLFQCFFIQHNCPRMSIE
jgi:hypothetical protein